MDYICVFAASSRLVDEKYLSLAYELGKRFAKSGYGLVFGGGNAGLMGAACRGFKAEGGSVLGVIPTKLNRPGIPFEECDELIETPTMHTRKAKMEELASGFVALPGGVGTLEELLEVITLKQLGYHNKPVVIVNYDGYYRNLIRQFDTCIDEKFTREECRRLYREVHSAEEAVEAVMSYRPESIPDKMEDALKKYD